jgi:hypothetical protein
MKLKQLFVLGCLAGFLASTPILAEGTVGTTDNQPATDKVVRTKQSNNNGKRHTKRRSTKRHAQTNKEQKEGTLKDVEVGSQAAQ